MSTEKKWYLNPETGKTGKYPVRVAETRPHWVEVDSSEATCVDCFIEQPSVPEYEFDSIVLDEDDETELEDN